MGLQRFVGNRWAGTVNDGFPSNAVSGSTLIRTDTAEIYYYDNTWRSAIVPSGYFSFSGYSGGGASGFSNIRKDVVTTTAPTGRLTQITLPAGGYVSGNGDKLLVFIEGNLQVRDTTTVSQDFDYNITNSGSPTTAGKVAFNYAIPSGTMLIFKYLFLFLFLLF
jgi:hypothetical protein